MVICGQCSEQFDSAEAELAHVCAVTGVPPTDPLTMGANYAAIQKAAIQRGADESTPDKVELALNAVAEHAMVNTPDTTPEAEVVSDAPGIVIS